MTLVVTARGSAERELQPERATLRASLGFESSSLDSAVSRTTALVTEVVPTLEELNGSAITKLVINPLRTSTWRPYANDGTLKPVRYSASVSISAEFVDFVELARTSVRLGERDGVSLNDVEWTLTPETRRAVEAEVLAEAIADAEARAEVMAHAAHCGGVEFTKLADSGLMHTEAAPAMLRTASFAQDAGFKVSPDDLTLSVTVEAQFEAS